MNEDDLRADSLARSTRRRAVHLFGRTAVYSVVFVLALEMLARADDWARWRAPFWENYSMDNLWAVESAGPRNQPHARFRHFAINSHGFRGPDFPARKNPGTIRVAMVGASETFGLYESPDHDLSSELQRALNRQSPGRYQVINAAAVGMSPPRARELYHQWLRRFDVDVVIFYPTPSFYLDDKPPREVQLAVPPRLRSSVRRTAAMTWRLTGKAWTVLREQLPDAIQVRIKEYQIARHREHYPGGPWQVAPEDRIMTFRRHLTEFLKDVPADGVRMILLTHATRFRPDWRATDEAMMVAWIRFFPRATGEALLDMEQRANQSIRELGRTLAVPVVDLAREVGGQSENFADFSHFTDLGARRAAEAICAVLLRTLPDTDRRTPRCEVPSTCHSAAGPARGVPLDRGPRR